MKRYRLNNYFSPHTLTRFVLALVFLFGAGTETDAQQTFQLKRTKRESAPIMVQLFGGYNGVSDPADKLQDQFENTYLTQWGGVMIGVQGLIVLDTVGFPLWIGIESYYNRMVKRYLGKIESVKYRSDGSPVETVERLYSYGGHVLLGIDVFKRFQLQLGAGASYFDSDCDVESEVIGLFQPIWIMDVFAATNIELLKYDHGSIDANFRFVRGFGPYGSFHFQSLLGFTFDF